MSNPSEAQRIAAVRKLTSELYVLQDRMNHTIDQITGLLHGTELAGLLPQPIAAQSMPDGALERSLSPSMLLLPLPSVYVDNPPNGSLIGEDCKLFCDYKAGHLQVVQTPATRGSDARYALTLNYAGLNASFLSLVFDARQLIAGLPAGRMRMSVALELANEQQAKLHAKFAFRVGNQWGENVVLPKGGRIQVDSFEAPMIDPSIVEALDFHLIFTPPARGCIELCRLTFSVLMYPADNSAMISATHVFEGEA